MRLRIQFLKQSFCLLSLLFVLFIVFSDSVTAQSNPLICSYTIGSSVSRVDGRISPYNQIKPGDTICVTAGTRGPLQFRNIKGTADQPITIVNNGGRVIINSSSGWYGFLFANAQYFRMTGTGSSDKYGFYVEKSVEFGIFLSFKSENFEVDHIEFNDVIEVGTGNNSIAIHAKTDATCPIPSGRNDDDYDYNADGKYDTLDMVNRDNFTQHNFIFHDNYFHGFFNSTNSNSIGMAYYIGNSNYYSPPTRTCTRADGTTYTATVESPIIDGVKIYNDIIDNLGEKTVQVGSARTGCDIYKLSINKACQEEPIDTYHGVTGIMINPASSCLVHNNLITNSNCPGIYYQGIGGKIYNNVLLNVGHPTVVNPTDPAVNYYREAIGVGGNHEGQNIDVINNTIINPVAYGISYATTDALNNHIQNNIIVNPGISAIASYGSGILVDHNYTTANVNDVKFTDPSINDFSLQLGSPAIDSGIDASQLGINDDYMGASRPQGSGFDIGAYEYQTNTTPTNIPTSTPVKQGDVNRDGMVNITDFQLLSNTFSKSQGQAGYNDNADFVDDNVINIQDFVLLSNNFGR